MRRRFALATLPALALGLALAACATPDAMRTNRSNVYFTADSAKLDENATTIVEQFAALANSKPRESVYVRGFAAPDTGTASYNRSLAETRAKAVADELTRHGVASSRIVIEPRGAVSFDSFPTESRRVEIALGR
jgi:outer membrane protein OmpA-like peptidoglycan-associated protein